jgi:hypothetical protein
MNYHRKVSILPWGLLALILAAVLVCLGCPTDAGGAETDPGGDETTDTSKRTLKVQVTDGKTRYFSLSSGKEVTDRASTEWDIAFQETRLIHTNSGEYADFRKSGGKGGVWHTEKESFDEVSLEDAVKDDPLYTPYNVDTIRWAGGMGGTIERYMNVMTFIGYLNENDQGIDGKTPATAFDSNFLYDKKPFYRAISMGVYEPTGRNYIILHGDGIHYSKIQVRIFIRDLSHNSDTYEVDFQNFSNTP